MPQNKKTIEVTRPYLPPIDEYYQYILDVWDRNWLTNNGPFVKELERKLKNFLDVDNLLFTTNGTIALQMAYKALNIEDEVITTPFSYVATTSSLVWENCSPVFADINPDDLTIDPNKIVKLINNKTTGILATHVFGVPCQVEAIEEIGQKYNLKIIYDGAHAFGTRFKGNSLFNYGDISILSTHATKVFHTIEGGAVITKDPDLLTRISFLRNFGHDGPGKFNGVGINGKNSEFHAAMGLANFKYINNILLRRKTQFEYYIERLKQFNVSFIKIPSHTDYNYSYFPLIFSNEKTLLKTNELLEKNNVFCRRYFYPALNNLEYIKLKGNTPIADDVSRRVLCLPLYHDLLLEEQDFIIKIINKGY